MAREIGKRLDSLRIRRSGLDRLGRLNEDARKEVLRKSLLDESWQRRSAAQPNTKYVLGAMAEVDPEYTRISRETADRVANQLLKDQNTLSLNVEFRLQGSVPLNIHIRGVSDVDLLNLDKDFHTYSISGLRSSLGMYRSPTSRTSTQVLMTLRLSVEKILVNRFPAADVDTSGGKAVKISGGSLARPVDVVASYWHDTDAYQISQVERDRGVTVLDKKVPETVDNLPFLHMYRVEEKDSIAVGGLKKAIRLCKNIKNDANDEGRNIECPSFDIAALMYHADMNALRSGALFKLSVLAETQRFLDYLYHNPTYAKSLIVPDGSRRVLDTERKYEGVKALSFEIDALVKDVAKEQSEAFRKSPTATMEEARYALANAVIV